MQSDLISCLSNLKKLELARLENRLLIFRLQQEQKKMLQKQKGKSRTSLAGQSFAILLEDILGAALTGIFCGLMLVIVLFAASCVFQIPLWEISPYLFTVFWMSILCWLLFSVPFDAQKFRGSFRGFQKDILLSGGRKKKKKEKKESGITEHKKKNNDDRNCRSQEDALCRLEKQIMVLQYFDKELDGFRLFLYGQAGISSPYRNLSCLFAFAEYLKSGSCQTLSDCYERYERDLLQKKMLSFKDLHNCSRLCSASMIELKNLLHAMERQTSLVLTEYIHYIRAAEDEQDCLAMLRHALKTASVILTFRKYSNDVVAC